jgi:transposase
MMDVKTCRNSFSIRSDLKIMLPATFLVQLAAVLNFDRVRSVLASHYSSTGRPSIDPELMQRMLLIGYVYRIRSERRLCSEVHLNRADRWFCRLGLNGVVPDHSTFSKNRYGRFRESDIYRVLFEDVVGQFCSAGLIGGSGFAVDGSLIGGDAFLQGIGSGRNVVTLAKRLWTRSVDTFTNCRACSELNWRVRRAVWLPAQAPPANLLELNSKMQRLQCRKIGRHGAGTWMKSPAGSDASPELVRSEP